VLWNAPSLGDIVETGPPKTDIGLRRFRMTLRLDQHNSASWHAWWKQNNLSGGSVSSSFKGFAETLSTNPPACGGA